MVPSFDLPECFGWLCDRGRVAPVVRVEPLLDPWEELEGFVSSGYWRQSCWGFGC